MRGDSNHVAITGATGGIGDALARRFADMGFATTLVGRNRDELTRLADRLGTPTHVCTVDLADPDQASRWIADAESALGPIDVLVNNAGALLVGPFAELDADAMRRLIQVDLGSPLEIVRAVLPRMLARGRGTIVNVASTGALAPNPGMVAYCAAKAGLATASECLRAELRGSGVDVITIYPGPTRTPMLRAALAGYRATPLLRGLPSATPERVADAIVRAVLRRKARVVTPRAYGWFRFLPGLAASLVARLTPRPSRKDSVDAPPPIPRLPPGTRRATEGEA